MNEINYIDYFTKRFSNLDKYGYNLLQSNYDNSEYICGFKFINSRINQEVTGVIFDHNPLNGSNDQFAIEIKIFRDKKHIDLSRLMKIRNFHNEFSFYQYIIVPKDENCNKILEDIFDFLYNINLQILNGKEWVNIEYDLRDDY